MWGVDRRQKPQEWRQGRQLGVGVLPDRGERAGPGLGQGAWAWPRGGEFQGCAGEKMDQVLSVTGWWGEGWGEGTPTCLSLALEEVECPWLRVGMETQGNVTSSPPNLVELDIGDISPGLF